MSSLYHPRSRNQWFENTFLPSFIPKMENKKYPNQAILSQKQYDICYKYMTVVKYGLVYESPKFSVIVWEGGRYKFIRVLQK